LADKIREDALDGACGTYEREGIYIRKVWWGRRPLKNIDVDGRLIFERTLKKQGRMS
jgi:hypothetical protein